MGIESLLSNPYTWLIVAAVAALIEMISVSLITVWFVIGAIVSFFIAFFGGPAWLQLVAFLVVSLACLALLRPVILKYRKQGQSHEPTLVGKNAVVVEEVNNDAMTGRVETPDRVSWTALSADGSIIGVGEQVRITDQKSIKLYVERI